MAKKYRVGLGVRVSNAFATTMLRAGIPMGAMRLLRVRGRKSGVIREVPIALGTHEGQRFIMAPFGDVQWVRNLRAAGEATLVRGRHTERITAVELPTDEAAAVLQANLGRAPGFVQQFFDVTPASSREAFLAEAPRHPVFVVQAAS